MVSVGVSGKSRRGAQECVRHRKWEEAGKGGIQRAGKRQETGEVDYGEKISAGLSSSLTLPPRPPPTRPHYRQAIENKRQNFPENASLAFRAPSGGTLCALFTIDPRNLQDLK
jgi:hypothetical protein